MLVGLAASAGVTGCLGIGTDAELSQEVACREHFKNDPAGRASCSADPASRRTTDVRPEDLPIRTDQRGQ